MQVVDQADLFVLNNSQFVAHCLHARNAVNAGTQLEVGLVLHHSTANTLHLWRVGEREDR